MVKILINQFNISVITNDYCDSPEFAQINFQDPATPTMEGIIDFHHDLFFYLIVIASFVTYALFTIIRHYHYSDLSVFPTKVEHNSFVEIIWTLIPAFILAAVAVSSLALLYSIDEVVKSSFTIKVIGKQWYWVYEYRVEPLLRDALVVEQRLEGQDWSLWNGNNAPSGTGHVHFLPLLSAQMHAYMPVRCYTNFLITSGDVLHSWAVPSLGVKVDACPGRLNKVSVIPKRTAVFYGQCSEICGIWHSHMPITLYACRPVNYVKNLFFFGQSVPEAVGHYLVEEKTS
jgi:cytochrome c oxidase subunit 2